MLHAGQPVARRVRAATPIVHDFQLDGAVMSAHADADLSSVCVFGCIRDRLGRHEVGGDLECGGEAPIEFLTTVKMPLSERDVPGLG